MYREARLIENFARCRVMFASSSEREIAERDSVMKKLLTIFPPLLLFSLDMCDA